MVFEGAGFKVEVVSFFGGTAKGALGGEAKVDVILEDVTDVVGDKYDAVVFVGGPGSVFYHKEEKAHALAKRAVESGLVVGAICLGPFILANAGVLKGHKATAWTGGKFTPGMLAARGAYFEDENVVVDDHIVTANGPDAAKEFALAVLNAVGGQQ
jgi:protease I